MPRDSRVLIVDDNASNRALAQAVLEDEGYVTTLASNGEEALRALEEERQHCVLLDVRMPDMDGLEVCRRIRQGKRHSDVPVVFLTAQRDIDTFDAAREAGGNDFLTKPLHPTELALRVRSALELGRLSAKLRDHVELVTRQRDDLVRLQLVKERLTAFLVHDLKNPVNSLDLQAQQALRDPELSERGRRSLLHIRDETRTLLRLILNLLDISRSDEGALQIRQTEVSVDELTASIVEELQLRAANSNVRITRVLKSATIHCDADLMRRVIANLVENAIRHAPEDSTVSIVVGPHESADQVRIEVSDQGVGIAPEHRERIFEPFVQLEFGERVVTRSGRGLGLTFCRVAVEAHGGSISVEDANPGATFALVLPCAARGEHARIAHAAPGRIS